MAPINTEEIKRMSVTEFRESGYLQELNRRFLHPLGLALYTEVREDGTETFNGVWDCRDDKTGIIYDIANSPENKKFLFKKRKEFVDSELEQKLKLRKELLGFDIEPIN